MIEGPAPLGTNRASSYFELLLTSDVVAGAIGSTSAHHGLVDLFDRISRHVTELFLGGRHRARRWLNVPSADGGVFFATRAGTRPRFQGGVDASHNGVYFRRARARETRRH